MRDKTKQVLNYSRIGTDLRFITRYRIIISQILFGILVLGYLFDFGSFTPGPGPLGIIAVAVISAGVGFRSWFAGIIRKNKALVTRGVYAVTRHPLYLLSFLMETEFLFLFWDVTFAFFYTHCFCNDLFSDHTMGGT